MTLFFEKQASGYRVKKKILLEKGRKYLFVGTIIRSGICSREYSPEVDLDGNISGWYRKFHEKTSYCRLFDRALTESNSPGCLNPPDAPGWKTASGSALNSMNS